MLYGLIGDIHGTKLNEIKKVFGDQGIGVLICNGDFDQVRTIREFMEWETELKQAGKEVIVVPGNHDEAILNNRWQVVSSTLSSQNTCIDELHQMIQTDPKAKQYLERLVNSISKKRTKRGKRFWLDQEKFGRTYRTVVVHGAWEGEEYSWEGCPLELQVLWNRLDNEYRKTPSIDAIQANFKAMHRGRCKIMIRGHDHKQRYIHQNKRGQIEFRSYSNSPLILSPEEKHIINPGSLFKGHYALLDTQFDEPRISYHKL